MLFPVVSTTIFFVVLSCQAQDSTTWNVILGSKETLTFTPPSLSGVSQGDRVTFEFASQNHSVVQSTFAAPCTAAGISSGFQAVLNPNQPPPTWSLTGEIWKTLQYLYGSFAITVNSTHCLDGMVFAINPTEEQSFAAFQLAAMSANSTLPVGENPSGSTTIADSTTITPLFVPPASSASSTTSDPIQNSQSTTSGVAEPTNSGASHSTSKRASTSIGAITGGVIGGIVVMIIGLFVLLRLRMRRNRHRREEVRKCGPEDLILAEDEEGSSSRDGQRQKSTDPMDPFQNQPIAPSISPFETTSTLNPGPPADSYSFRSTITFAPTESSSVVKFSHTSPIREKASIGGSNTEGIMEESRDSRDQQSGQQSSEMVANPDIWDNSEQTEPSQQIPAIDIPGQPGTGGLAIEEIALLRELRELQIVRRLEEIRNGRSAGAEQPPPEYE